MTAVVCIPLYVHSAGHMVPQYAPEAALTFFTRYLTKTPY